MTTTIGEVTRINMQPLGRGSSRISPQTRLFHKQYFGYSRRVIDFKVPSQNTVHALCGVEIVHAPRAYDWPLAQSLRLSHANIYCSDYCRSS
jgi:hypothetical protein